MRGGSVGFLGRRVKAPTVPRCIILLLLLLLLLILLLLDRQIRSRIMSRSRSGGESDDATPNDFSDDKARAHGIIRA
jgi:hypothetical protein